jgi:hypothetical protein
MEAVKLDKALSDFRNAATLGKSGKNPMFKSQYSTLGDVLSALNKISDYGLAFKQYFSDDCLVTTVSHIETGEKFDSAIPIRPEKNTPQSYISCVTYLRRASLMTMFGLNADDDDGNLASGNGASSSRSQPSQKAPAVAPTSAVGVAFPNIEKELQKCNSVRDVNALYTTLVRVRDVTPDEIEKMRIRKEELK